MVQAEYVVHILAVAPHEYVNICSTRRLPGYTVPCPLSQLDVRVMRAEFASRSGQYSVPIDYRIVPGSFPNPVLSVGVCYTAVDAVAGGLTTGWWAVVLECFSSHLLVPRVNYCILRGASG